MTKRDFAIRLLFWLTPWPISRALPKAFRIFYWGPSGIPPEGWSPDFPPGSLPPGDIYMPGPWGWNPLHQGDPDEKIWELYTYTNDNYWQCNANCTAWDGSKWEMAGPGMSLKVKTGTTWADGYVPTKMRVTYTGDVAGMTLGLGKLPGGNDYLNDTNYISGKEVDITVTDDIARINLYGDGVQLSVTKIQFYLP